MKHIDIKQLKSSEIEDLMKQLELELSHRPSFSYVIFHMIDMNDDRNFVILDAIVKEDCKDFVRANLTDETWINKVVMKIFSTNEHLSRTFNNVEDFSEKFVNYSLTNENMTELQMANGCPYFDINRENNDPDNKDLTYKVWLWSKHTQTIFTING